MSNVAITLTANTSLYTQRIKNAKTETDRNIIKMEQRFDSFANDVSKNMTSVNGVMDGLANGLRTMKFGGYIAGAAGLSFAVTGVANAYVNMGKQAVENNKILTKTAQYTRMTTDELVMAEGALKSIGVTMEQFGDWGKDLLDKMGDFATAGSGPFVDFFDVIRTGSKMTIADLQGLSTIDAYKKIVSEMEAVGASFEQITWVMEGLGNEAASLVPLLVNGGKEYERLVAKMHREKIQLLGSTKEDFQSLDASMQAASHNFEVYLTERFKSVASKFDVLWNSISGKFKDAGEIEQSINISATVGDGTFSVDSIKSVEEANKIYELLNNTLTDTDTKIKMLERRDGTGIMSQFNASVDINKIKEAEDLKNATIAALEAIEKKKEELAAKSANKYGTANLEGVGNESDLMRKQHQLQQSVDLEKKAHEERLANEQKAAEYRANARKAESDEEKKRLNDLANEYDAKAKSNLQREKVEASNQQKLRKEVMDAANKDYADQLKNKEKFALEGAEKLRAAHEVELNDLQQAFAKQEITQEQFNSKQLEMQTKLNEELNKLNEDKTKKADELEMKRLSAAVMYAVDGNSKLAAQYKLDTINLKKALDDKLISQDVYNANLKSLEEKHDIAKMNAKVEAEIKMLGVKRQYATTEAEERELAHKAELEQLKIAKNDGLVTEAEFINKKAQLNRAFEENERTMKMDDFMTNEAIELMNAQIEMERLEEQRGKQLISEDEFEKQRELIAKRTADAKMAFAMAELDTLSTTFGQMASMAEEGSSRQKAALVAQQAATVASMTMNQWQAWSNIDAADSPYKNPIAAGIAKAAVVAQYAAGIANVGAAISGQFHNGGEIDQTGSYILKQGERVVAPDTNKDLKSFLSESKGSTGEMIVNADMIIQGDTQIDENRFKAMLVQHRENITQAVRLAQREQPSLRF